MVPYVAIMTRLVFSVTYFSKFSRCPRFIALSICSLTWWTTRKVVILPSQAWRNDPHRLGDTGRRDCVQGNGSPAELWSEHFSYYNAVCLQRSLFSPPFLSSPLSYSPLPITTSKISFFFRSVRLLFAAAANAKWSNHSLQKNMFIVQKWAG